LGETREEEAELVRPPLLATIGVDQEIELLLFDVVFMSLCNLSPVAFTPWHSTTPRANGL
jgi:hypothetical protein